LIIFTLDMLVGGIVTCFLSLCLILFCGCIGFVAKCTCVISVCVLGVI
jgi:hypothetical protein